MDDDYNSVYCGECRKTTPHNYCGSIQQTNYSTDLYVCATCGEPQDIDFFQPEEIKKPATMQAFD